MNNYQNRLVLQYDSGAQVWHELQRNGVSPDYYFPISLDEVGQPDEQRYTSVWLTGPSGREWRVTSAAPIPLNDPLERFDEAMRTYMQDRNATGSALAITVDGRLVLARGYNWEIPEASSSGGWAAAARGRSARDSPAASPATLLADAAFKWDEPRNRSRQ
jgi:hypothetical protein